MSDRGTRFKSSQDVYDDIRAARDAQQHALLLLVCDSRYRFSRARVSASAYVTANLEVNRLIEIDNQFRER